MTTEETKIIQNLHNEGDKQIREARKCFKRYDKQGLDDMLKISDTYYRQGCDYHRQACEMYNAAKTSCSNNQAQA